MASKKKKRMSGARASKRKAKPRRTHGQKRSARRKVKSRPKPAKARAKARRVRKVKPAGRKKTVRKVKPAGRKKTVRKVRHVKKVKNVKKKHAGKVKHISKVTPAPRSQLEMDMGFVEEEISRLKEVVEKPETLTPVVAPKAVSASDFENRISFIEKVLYSGSSIGTLAFYFLTSLVSVAVLAFLFGSWKTFIAFMVFGIFLWWWSHQFHVTKTGLLKSFLSLGSMVIVLYFMYWFFDDLLSVLVCILYALSFVIGGVLYLYHFKRGLSGEVHQSFARTFLVVFYSHVIAFAAASLLAYLIPFLAVGDGFVTVIYLLLVWVFPPLLLYFFLNKFLYLRFFDSVHLRRDALKGLVHGVGYSCVFIVLLMLVYLLTAVQFAGAERSAYESTFNQVSTELSNVGSDISVTASDAHINLLGLEVVQDVLRMSNDTIKDVAAARAGIVADFSAGDYFSDRYFTALARERVVVSGIASYAYGIDQVKSDLIREYRRVRWFEKEGTFDDGTASIGEHSISLDDYLAVSYIPYVEPYRIARLKQKAASADSYSALLADGELVDLDMLYDPDLEVILPGKSRFSQAAYDTLYHTVVFRDFTILVLDSIAIQLEETIEPAAYREIYDSAPADESLYSRVLRQRILRSNIEANLALAGESQEEV